MNYGIYDAERGSQVKREHPPGVHKMAVTGAGLEEQWEQTPDWSVLKKTPERRREAGSRDHSLLCEGTVLVLKSICVWLPLERLRNHLKSRCGPHSAQVHPG